MLTVWRTNPADWEYTFVATLGIHNFERRMTFTITAPVAIFVLVNSSRKVSNRVKDNQRAYKQLTWNLIICHMLKCYFLSRFCNLLWISILHTKLIIVRESLGRFHEICSHVLELGEAILSEGHLLHKIDEHGSEELKRYCRKAAERWERGRYRNRFLGGRWRSCIWSIPVDVHR